MQILSLACGGRLNPKEVALNVIGATAAIAVMVVWGLCCYALFYNWI